METREGQCRLLPSMSGLPAETIPLWRRAVAPIIEHIAVMFAGSDIPTVLTQQKRSAARPQNGKVKRKRGTSITLPRQCKRCGEAAPKERRLFCSEVCRVLYQGEILAETKEQLSDTSTWYAPMPKQGVPNVAPRAIDLSIEMKKNLSVITSESRSSSVRPRGTDGQAAAYRRAMLRLAMRLYGQKCRRAGSTATIQHKRIRTKIIILLSVFIAK